MIPASSLALVPQIGTLYGGGVVAGLSDRQLLERFVARRDNAGEAAFAALVARHGTMVLGVCRQLVGDRHEAEDAFQAVFLVLARKARTIRDPELLGNWLYGVALRTARKARGRCARRRKTEEAAIAGQTAAHPAAPADAALLARERAEVLHREIDRLPGSFRAALLLCYFEGLSPDEAAQRLRWPAGTVRSRLVRAREKLRKGLVRRGVVLPAAALMAVLEARPAAASVSPILCGTTARAATPFATRHPIAGALPASAAVLAQEVLRTMLLHKLRLTALSLLLLAAVATGAGALTRSLATKEGPMQDPAATAAKAAPRDDVRPRPEAKPDAETPNPGRMTVAGRVLDPNGKPVAGAVVEVLTRPRKPWVGASDETDQFALLAQGQSGGDGHYRLDAPRTASVRDFEVHALAAAPGYGLGWAELNPDAEQPTAEIKLAPEQPVRVRLVDVTGTPARGVEVRVLSVGRESDRGTFDGISLLWFSPSEGTRTWPQPVATDDQGKLALHNIGRGVGLVLGVRDLRYARQELYIQPDAAAGDVREITLALEPARIITGRVLAADTGQPLADTVVSATARIQNEHANGFFTEKFRTDAAGRFVMNPNASEQYTLGAFPATGAPYLIQQDELKWTKGAARISHDITVRRGVLIQGRVTEVGTGRPLPASSIQFIPVRIRGSDDVLSGWQAIVASGDNGSFQIAVSPGKGHLLVFGPTGDYVLEEIGSHRLDQDRAGGRRYHAHAIVPYEVKAGGSPHEAAAALRSGVTIKGRVLGPDGQTIINGLLLTALRIEAFNPFWRGDFPVSIRDGRFELHGLAPEASTRVSILDPEHEWGASADVTGKQAGADVTIRLQPCGRALARFIGSDGQPIAGHRPHFEFVMTPGPSRFSRSRQDQAELSSETELMVNLDRKHYWNGFQTDAAGRVTMPALIPGARYQILDLAGRQVRKEFTVKSGETLDLGDILIDKREAQ